MADFSLKAAAGQALVAGFGAEGPPPALRQALRQGELGGVILFKRNVGEPEQVAALVDSIAREAPGDQPPLVAVDQEGGRVARLGPPVIQLPPMRRLGEQDDAAATRDAARRLGAQLRALGFTMDFAPVLDVDTNPDNPIIGDRSFGRTPEVVIRHALAFAEGLGEGGVLSCGKHFPGHGDTDLDSHLALPRLPHDRARLDRIELAPFRAAVGRIPSIMTAHVVFEALDPGVPATLSRKVVTDLLRGELGYDGVVVSDDLEMKAVSERWGIPEAAVAAVEAGCDVVLVCSQVEACLAAHEALVRRAERDAGFAERLQEAARRSLSLRSAVPPRPITDPDALRAELARCGAPGRPDGEASTADGPPPSCGVRPHDRRK